MTTLLRLVNQKSHQNHKANRDIVVAFFLAGSYYWVDEHLARRRKMSEDNAIPIFDIFRWLVPFSVFCSEGQVMNLSIVLMSPLSAQAL